MREKYLPIGTVVLLKGGKKRAMITGFCSVAQEDQEKIYDYSGCVYPEGYLSSNQVCLFDHDQIEKIFFVGYEDEEEKEFKEKLNQIVKTIEQENSYEPDYSSSVDEDMDETDENIDTEDEIDEDEDIEELDNTSQLENESSEDNFVSNDNATLQQASDPAPVEPVVNNQAVEVNEPVPAPQAEVNPAPQVEVSQPVQTPQAEVNPAAPTYFDANVAAPQVNNPQVTNTSVTPEPDITPFSEESAESDIKPFGEV